MRAIGLAEVGKSTKHSSRTLYRHTKLGAHDYLVASDTAGAIRVSWPPSSNTVIET